MRFRTMFSQEGQSGGWLKEFSIAAVAVALGFGVMPGLIFVAGSTLLGRYDNAGAGRLYESVFDGLKTGSTASWIVVFGPYGLYLLFKTFRFWWRVSARLA